MNYGRSSSDALQGRGWRQYINPWRLLFGAAVVAAMLLPLYLTLPRGDDAAAEPRARLLDTPPAAGRNLSVGLAPGQLAPDFEVASAAEGTLRLSDFRGLPLVINFWAAWCVSCLSEMPEIKRLQEEIGVDKVGVLAINVGESRSRAREFIDFLQAPFFFGLDRDLTLADAYGVYGLPLSVFVDASGVVQAVYRGHASRPLLERFVRAAMDARPPGEVEPVLRTLTTVPRERVLRVTREGAGKLRFESRALRCDPLYCAESAVAALRAVAGIEAARLSGAGPEPRLTVTFDRRRLSADEVVNLLVRALEARADPVYDTPIQVKQQSK